MSGGSIAIAIAIACLVFLVIEQTAGVGGSSY